MPITGLTAIAIDTAGGDDALTLDLSGGAFPIGIQVSGGSDGQDSLEIAGFDTSSQFNAVTATYSNAHDGLIQLRQGATVLTTVSYSALDTVRLDGSPIEVVFDLPSGANSGVSLLDVGGADGALRLSGSTLVATDFSLAAAASLVIHGNTGDDQITVQSLDVGFVGTLFLDGRAGNDTLTGSARGDVLIGGEGNDLISAGDGGDSVFGGAGADTLRGDNGNDVLNGNSQADRLEGGGGDDVLNGGSSADVML